MTTTPDWDALVDRFGPLAAAAKAPRAALQKAAGEGRLFRLVVQRDGFGSGEVSIDALACVPSSLAFGAHGSVAWECFFFSTEGVIDGLASAARYGWESFGDVPGLPRDLVASARDPDATLSKLLREVETPPWAFALAALDPDAYLRMFVASYQGSPAHALRLLARDPDEDVRLALARHRNTPPEALEILAAGTDLSAARSVGENPSTPRRLLESLAVHPVCGVRFGVACNQKAPADILARLSLDPDESVRAVAKLARR